MTKSAPAPFRFQLHTPNARVGEKLVGDLLVMESAAAMDWARHLSIRAVARVQYSDDEIRGVPVPVSSEVNRKWPPRGESKIPFELTLPRDVPASHKSEAVEITWELVATLSNENGKKPQSWSQPFKVEMGRTTQPPQWLTPSEPRSSSGENAASYLGCMGVVAFFGVVTPLAALFGDKEPSQSKAGAVGGAIFAVVLLIVSLAILAVLVFGDRSALKFKKAALVPLAERFPLGSTARLRAFVDLRTPITIEQAKLELCVKHNGKKLCSTGEVPIKVPAHLHSGASQFDVEIPIPRDFLPTFKYAENALCSLELLLPGRGRVTLSTELELSWEVLEQAA